MDCGRLLFLSSLHSGRIKIDDRSINQLKCSNVLASSRKLGKSTKWPSVQLWWVRVHAVISGRPAETMEECMFSTLPKNEVIFDPIKVKEREDKRI